jgi:hypothetical protein
VRLLDGVISARLRDTFGMDVGDWPTYRAPEAIRTMPEENYTGRTLAPTYRRIGRHPGETT